jgi:hypothetical protein
MLYDCPLYAHLYPDYTYSDGLREDFPESAKRVDEWKTNDLWAGGSIDSHTTEFSRELIKSCVKYLIMAENLHEYTIPDDIDGEFTISEIEEA